MNTSLPKLLRNVGLGLAGICLSAAAFAQPANDNCSGAIALAVNTTCVGTAGNATGATQSQAGCTGTANDDVWYKFVATSSSHNVSVTGASGYDAVLQVFSGTCGSLSNLSCRDITFGGGTETASLTGLTVGATYYFRVYDWYSSTLSNPSFSVCVVGVAPPPDPCLGVNNITCGSNNTISLSGAGAWNVTTCGFSTPGAEKIYTFTAPINGSYTFTVSGGTGGYIDWFIKPTSAGCGSSGWTCIDDISGSASLSLSLTAGTYYLLGDAESTSAVNQTFSISCGTPFATNDDCSGAKPLACGQTLTGSTVSTNPDNSPACSGLSIGTGGGVWYKVVGNGGFLTASTCNAATNYDTKLHVYEGSCSALSCVTANDDYFSTPYTCASSSLNSIAEWCSVSGQTYYILVSGFGTATGNFAITLDCNSAPTVAITAVGPFCQTAASVTLSASPLGGTFSGPGVSAGVFSPAAAGPGTHTITYTVCGLSATTTITVTPTPGNDLCTGAISIAAGNSYSGNTSCASIDASPAFCVTTGGTAPGVWYSFVGDGKRWSFSTCNAGTDYDTKLHAFTGSCSSLTCIDGNDDLGISCATGPGVPDFKSGLSFCTTIGRTYYVLVHGFSSNVGNYQLDVTSTAGPSGSISASTYGCGFNVSCNGGSNGSATVTGSGGAGLYSYTWSNGQTGATATGLSAGTYTVTITDANGCQGTASVTLTQPTAVVANAGANTTVIFGYPAANNCADLTASGSGGCGPYSYAWSNGGTTATINVCPSTTTDYTVTVTDANGCSATDVVRVCVNNVICGRAGNNPKILVCHVPPGNPSNAHEVCIAYPAVNAHLNHGDYLGACGSNVAPCLDGGSNSVAKSAGAIGEMTINAFPNPFQRSTTVQFSVASDERVTVKVYNLLGAEIATLFEGMMAAGEAREVAFTPNNAAQGMYLVKVSTASGASMTKRVTME
jgi:hypothetical protein